MARRAPPPLQTPAETPPLPPRPGELPNERTTRGWHWLPPFPPAEEIAVRVVIGLGAAAVGVIGLALALGSFPGVVAGPLGAGSRLLLGALGALFSLAALAAWLDAPPRPLARWRRTIVRATRRAEIFVMVAAGLAGLALALRWLD